MHNQQLGSLLKQKGSLSFLVYQRYGPKDEDKMVEFSKILKDLVAINSENPPGKCLKIAEYVANFFKRNTKAQVILQKIEKDKMNVIIKFGSPYIFINAHLDTVPRSSTWNYSPYKLKVKDSKFFGLGVTDVKGAVSAMLCALQFAKPKNLLFLFNPDEEHGNNRGVKTFLVSKYAKRLKYGIVTEPTRFNTVTLHNGICGLEVNFTGKSAHASMPERGVNAIELATDFMQKLIQYKSVLSQRGLNGLKPALNIGVIKGGTKPNMVADNCSIKIDRRYLPNETDTQVLKEIKKLVSNKNASIKITYAVPPLNTNFKSKLLSAVLKSCGAKSNIKTANFWSEAALFSKAGKPTVVFGPGNIENAHCANEFIGKKDLEKSVKIYKRLFSRF
jgi:acetylornithine deacetylase/succinyl-diaminopimelate desuccinylase family protein